jgi:hypothetical protein
MSLHFCTRQPDGLKNLQALQVTLGRLAETFKTIERCPDIEVRVRHPFPVSHLPKDRQRFFVGFDRPLRPTRDE